MFNMRVLEENVEKCSVRFFFMFKLYFKLYKKVAVVFFFVYKDGIL